MGNFLCPFSECLKSYIDIVVRAYVSLCCTKPNSEWGDFLCPYSEGLKLADIQAGVRPKCNYER